jgi:hypothetical protein
MVPCCVLWWLRVCRACWCVLCVECSCLRRKASPLPPQGVLPPSVSMSALRTTVLPDAHRPVRVRETDRIFVPSHCTLSKERTLSKATHLKSPNLTQFDPRQSLHP